MATGPVPGAEPESPPPTRSASLLWLATAGTAWVIRRCNDLLPQLLCLAADELRHRAAGTSGRLDLRAAQSVSAALAALPVPVRVPAPVSVQSQSQSQVPLPSPEPRSVPRQWSVAKAPPVTRQCPVPGPRPEPEAA